MESRRLLVSGILKNVIKLRYWIATGFIGGSLAVSNRYEEWKRSLPEISLPDWLKIDESRLEKISEKYKKIEANFWEKERRWLDVWQERINSFENMWHRGPIEGLNLFLLLGKFHTYQSIFSFV